MCVHASIASAISISLTMRVYELILIILHFCYLLTFLKPAAPARPTQPAPSAPPAAGMMITTLSYGVCNAVITRQPLHHTITTTCLEQKAIKVCNRYHIRSIYIARPVTITLPSMNSYPSCCCCSDQADRKCTKDTRSSAIVFTYALNG